MRQVRRTEVGKTGKSQIENNNTASPSHESGTYLKFAEAGAAMFA
jgi:hypothetical protein